MSNALAVFGSKQLERTNPTNIQFSIPSIIQLNKYFHPIDIILNGEKRKFSAPLTVAELLRILNLRSQQVLVERNFSIVPREELTDTEVKAGDRIEILRLVGGE